MQCKDEWLPEEDMALVDEACKSIYDEEDIGFLDVVFGVQSWKDQEDFNQDLFDHHYRFLQPHRIRQMVYVRLMSLLNENVAM